VKRKPSSHREEPIERGTTKQKNQWREKWNAIRRIKRGRSAMESEESKGGEVQCNQKNQKVERQSNRRNQEGGEAI